MKATSSTTPEEFSTNMNNERSEQGQAEFAVNQVTFSASTTTPVKIPDHLICPITLQVMRHPLTTRNGLNFERSAILNWLQRSEFCPLTRRPLRPSDLIRNRNLEVQIEYWRRMNGWNETTTTSTGEAEATAVAVTMGEPCAPVEVPSKAFSEDEESNDDDEDDEPATRVFGFMSVTDEKEEEILQRHYHRHNHHHHRHRHHSQRHHHRRTLEHREAGNEGHTSDPAVVPGTERRRSILARILTSASA